MTPHPAQESRQELADKIGVDIKKITTWFINRRAKAKIIEQREALAAASVQEALTDEEDEERGEEEDGESSELRADNRGGAAADSVGDGSSAGGATEGTRPMQQEPPQAASYPPGALVLPIPSDRELLAIEHPCYVVNPDKGCGCSAATPPRARPRRTATA